MRPRGSMQGGHNLMASSSGPASNNNIQSLNGKNALQMSMNMSKQAMDLSKQAAESLFSSHLASALSTISDSQFFQDSISPSTIRNQFNTSDPSNPTSTPTLINSMKWLLASMSKGRNVSDFFPSVVKLVACHNLELRKMVYMYLVHYADHDATCRDLALLSINAFQRGLSDSEQWIRALALRVLTSVRVDDVIQIQILAVQTCTKDPSPYVRKCASTAMGKLYPRLNRDEDSQVQIIDMLKELLTKETSTMVLVSLMYSFTEICPERLDMLHGCYRKLCHLLTDMDEWGQVIVMDVLSRYCRSYFAKPINVVGGGEVLGSAEIIDRQRRVVRKLNKDGHGISTGEDMHKIANEQEDDDETQNVLLPPVKSAGKAAVVKKSKRRVVKKAFYSDEEDESSDEDLIPQAAILASKNHSVASSMRQRNVLGFGDGISGVDGNYGPNGVGGVADATGAVDEDSELDEDHRLLLRSSLPLLKSRNSAVVLGVCSLHYYCGVASIKIRSALGKALVRIYHDRREIQFVVLNSIRMLVWECPSAFTPFLNNFFVKAMDPSFTRLIKLDILSALALEPNSINAVLNELRVYIRHDDKDFVCAAVQAVGKIVEMAQIIYDRQGAKTGNIKAMKKESNVIALNCLHGILTLMESSSHAVVVGECINVTQRILLLLKSSASEDQTNVVLDPSHVQFMSLRRLVLLVVSSLTSQSNAEVDEDEDLDSNGEMNSFKEQIISLPTQSIGPALWIIGDHLCVDDNVNLLRVSGQEKKLILSELLRIMAKMFQDMSPYLKCHCIHFASKTIISNHTARNGQYQDRSLCEYILALGRTDINQDVRDRSRNESLVIHISVGIQYDVETLPPLPMNGAKITMENAKSMLLQNKPSSSWLPLDDINGVTSPFRFGTLSSMVSHKAGRNYMSLPDWAEFNSPKTLRDQPQDKVEVKKKESKKKRDMFDKTKKSTNGFYDSDSSTSSDDDESTSESSSSSSESESSSSSESESSSSSDDTVSDESTSSEEDPETLQPQKHILPIESNVVPSVIEPMKSIVDSSDEDSSSDDNSSSSDESTVDSEANGKEPVTRHAKVETNPMSSLLDMNFNGGEIVAKHKNIEKVTKKHVDDAKNASTDSIVTGLEGLVMAPLKIDKKKLSSINIEEECSDWIVLVRPDLSGGLSVTSRFLRNGVRKRELLLLGLEPKKSSVICIQMKFENKRTDGRGIRRIRLLQKSIAASGIVATTKIVVPQEIDMLNSSQMSYAMIAIEFAHISDKDGAMHSRIDIKCDRSSTTVDIRPPLTELLMKKVMTQQEFDESFSKYHSIHQRGVSKFDLSNSEESISMLYRSLPSTIIKNSTLSLVGDKEWIKNSCNFSGSLPESGKEVLVKIHCDDSNGKGELTICCDNAMSLNSLLALLKIVIK